MAPLSAYRNDPYVQKVMQGGFPLLFHNHEGDDFEMCSPLGMRATFHKVHVSTAICLAMDPVERFSLSNLMVSSTLSLVLLIVVIVAVPLDSSSHPLLHVHAASTQVAAPPSDPSCLNPGCYFHLSSLDELIPARVLPFTLV